jgi:tetratricopeptide (TPR) repeat protein
VNRPNYGGNNFGGNNFGGNSFQGGNTYNINSNRSYSSGYNNAPVIAGNVGGGWGGGGWGGGYRGGWGGGGWSAPYYGNWYRGSFGNAGSFWTGFGVGALTSFGLGSLYGGWGSGWGGYGAGVYNYFPTWGMGTYSGWGLAPVATNWLYSDYSNPYYATVAAAQPAVAPAAYDYSQPINVAAAPPDAAVADSTEQVFSAARDSFKAGDYQRALDLADQVLKQTPNVAVVHEFRALALFALKRYDEAASVVYAVLSAGPGWNWSTLIGLYPSVDPYTDQLRALEAYAGSNQNSSSARFLLGYHYMVEGHDDLAAAQFERVTQLLPQDTLSASFVKALRKSSGQVAQTSAPTQAPASNAAPAHAPAQAPQGVSTPDQETSSPPPPPPPPASMAGTWKSQPSPDVAIALTLKEDGGFVWDVNTKGQKQTLQGQAGFQDNTLILQQPEGPPLVGNVTRDAPDKFVFAPPGAGGKGGGLVFTR